MKAKKDVESVARRELKGRRESTDSDLCLVVMRSKWDVLTVVCVCCGCECGRDLYGSRRVRERERQRRAALGGRGQGAFLLWGLPDHPAHQSATRVRKAPPAGNNNTQRCACHRPHGAAPTHSPLSDWAVTGASGTSHCPGAHAHTRTLSHRTYSVLVQGSPHRVYPS